MSADPHVLPYDRRDCSSGVVLAKSHILASCPTSSTFCVVVTNPYVLAYCRGVLVSCLPIIMVEFVFRASCDGATFAVIML